MKFYYSVNKKEAAPDNRLMYEDLWVYEEYEMQDAVNEIAHDHYTRYAGWASWGEDNKLDLYVWSENHEYVGKYLVRLESEPRFHSVMVKE